MKVVFASTPDQQEKIMELVDQIYSEVFPLYFSDSKIAKFREQNILNLSGSMCNQLDTLKDAYQVIASLQTLIHILASKKLDDQYMEKYYKNVSILEEYGLYFPLEYKQFIEAKVENNSKLSMYTKVANDLLI